jgi:hypothetical protein
MVIACLEVTTYKPDTNGKANLPQRRTWDVRRRLIPIISQTPLRLSLADLVTLAHQLVSAPHAFSLFPSFTPLAFTSHALYSLLPCLLGVPVLFSSAAWWHLTLSFLYLFDLSKPLLNPPRF